MRYLLFIGLLFFSFNSCGEKEEKVVIDVKSRIINTTTPFQGDDTVNTILSYQVLFKEIRVGNSEDDAEVLWHSIAGETKDIATEVEFDQVNEIEIGEFEFIELTIGKKLYIEGSKIVDGETVVGQGEAELKEVVFLFGIHDGTLSEKIKIEEGKTLYFDFNILNSVKYISGEADDAELSVAKPIITVSS